VLNDNSQHLRFTLFDHTGPVNTLVSLKENLLASGSYDTTIKIWNLNQAKNPKFTLNSFNGHRKQVNFLCSLGENQGHLASGSTSETFIKIWDYNEGIFINEYNHVANIKSLVYLGQNLLISCSSYKIIVWDILDKRIKHQIDSKIQFNLLISLQNNMIASASENEIKIWILSKNRINEKSKLNIKPLVIKSMLSLDENKLAFGTGDGKVVIWRISENITDEFKGHSKSVRHLIKSNSWLISGSDDHTVCVWGYHTGEIKIIFNSSNGSHTGIIYSLVLLSDHAFVSGSEDLTIKIWDLTTYSLKFTFDSSNGGHTDKITQLVSMSQSGRQLASASKNGEIKIWQNLD
jgi:WD40 repeat protein